MKYLILDCHNLCWRAFHAHGYFSHNGGSTGVLYGFFRDIAKYCERHGTTNVLFCFDLGRPLRIDWLNSYKAHRSQQLTAAEVLQRKEVSKQIDKIRLEYLPKIGFKNIYAYEGYEADDLIASLVRTTLDFNRDKAVIVSSDKDLYQLLNKKVSIDRPGVDAVFDFNQFNERYGIAPALWVELRSMVGDTSDNVKGVPLVGEITGLKWMRSQGAPVCDGKMVKGKVLKAFQNIKNSQELIERNRRLFQLPFPGTPRLSIQEETLSRTAWNKSMLDFGARTLVDAFPFGE